MKKAHLIKHPSKRKALFKFIIILLVFLSYFGFIAFKYGLEKGWQISLITWSFFVLCTPIADAGFILDFPIRIITKMRMIFSEIGIWIFAILINIYFHTTNPAIYEDTSILRIFKQILTQPIPFWIIIILAASGTFLSIKFGDELMDVIHLKQCKNYQKHKRKHHFIILSFSLIFVFLSYFYFLEELNINIGI